MSRGKAMSKETYELAIKMMETENIGVTEAAKRVGVSYNTLYAAIKRGSNLPKPRYKEYKGTILSDTVSFRFDPKEQKIFIVCGLREISMNKEEFIDKTMVMLNLLEKMDEM